MYVCMYPCMHVVLFARLVPSFWLSTLAEPACSLAVHLKSQAQQNEKQQ